MAYQAIVAALENVRKHPNADKIKLATVFDAQIVVGLDAKDGDVGIYFPSDGQLSHEFLMANKLYRKDPTTNQPMGGYFESNRRVRIQKFRGEISDGFWCPLEYVAYTNHKENLAVGFMFSELNGHEVCRKFIRETKESSNRISNNSLKTSTKKKSYPLFNEIGDTTKFSYQVDTVPVGAYIVISEKLHGTSGRTGLTLRKQKANWVDGVLSKFGYERKSEWELVTGTRRTVLAENSYHTKDTYRLCVHGYFDQKLHRGETVYYEIVGYDMTSGSIMPRHSTDKFPEISKHYGLLMRYDYTTDGITKFFDVFVYKITQQNEDGHIVSLSWFDMEKRCKELGLKTVPVIRKMVYDGDKAALMKFIKENSDGPSMLNNNHIREGVVVYWDGKVGKYKGDSFCLLEDIAKEKETYIDIEEEQGDLENV